MARHDDAPVKRAVARPKGTRKAAPKTPTAPPRDPWTGLMDDGDTYTYGASMEVKSGGKTFWPKASVAVHKRPGESEDQTAARAAQIVHGTLEAIINEFIGD